MTQRIEAPQTITIDNQEFPISQFSEQVKNLIEIHTQWRNELTEERLAVAKTENALRALDSELAQTIAKELEEQAAPTPEPDQATS
jgi:uncharacterized coiled-coil protein SlyX